MIIPFNLFPIKLNKILKACIQTVVIKGICRCTLIFLQIDLIKVIFASKSVHLVN